jgi:hypothetical protein
MSFIATAFTVAGAVGGYQSSKDARAGIERMRNDEMKSYNFSEPYIERSYDAAEDYLKDVQKTGNYQGQTYTGYDPYSAQGNRFMGNMGAEFGQQARNMANQNVDYASNYRDLYQKSQGDFLNNATQYAANNAQPLVNTAMRDSRRNLEENTLPGINMGASSTGNMNSSRAGMAEGIAQRGYADREADMTASIQDRLIDRSMNQQNTALNNQFTANAGIAGAYNTGMSNMARAGNWMTDAGTNRRNYYQGYMDDQRGRFERDRDFGLEQQIKYQNGILSRADYTSSAAPYQEKPNVLGSTIGGAMSGFSMGGSF